jgi:hypothetical protein
MLLQSTLCCCLDSRVIGADSLPAAVPCAVKLRKLMELAALLAEARAHTMQLHSIGLQETAAAALS